MGTEEIVRALRNCDSKESDCLSCGYCKRDYSIARDAADLIESLQAQLAASQRRAQDARNELCQKCGRYREAHNGACNWCRWKE